MAEDDHATIRLELKDELTRPLKEADRALHETEASADGTAHAVSNLGTEMDKTAAKAVAFKAVVGKGNGGKGGGKDTGLVEGFFDAWKGALALGEAMSLIKFPAMIAGASLGATGLLALASAGFASLAALGPSGGLLAVLPSLGLALGSVALVGKSALSGVGAMAAMLNDPTATRQGIAMALAKMTPAARQFSYVLAGMQQEYQRFQQLAGQAMFPGLSRAIHNLIPIIPVIEKGLVDVARVMGDTAAQGAKMISSGPWRRDINDLLQTNVTVVQNGGQMFLHFANAMRNVMIAAQPLVRWLSRVTLEISKHFDAWTAGQRANGGLTQFFGETIKVVGGLARAFGNIAEILWNVGRAAYGFGTSINGGIGKGLASFAEWSGSTSGQTKLINFFQNMKDVAGAVLRLFEALGRGIGTIFGAGNNQIGKGGGVVGTLDAITKNVPAIAAAAANMAQLAIALTQLVAPIAALVLHTPGLGKFIAGMYLLKKLGVFGGVGGLAKVGAKKGFGSLAKTFIAGRTAQAVTAIPLAGATGVAGEVAGGGMMAGLAAVGTALLPVLAVVAALAALGLAIYEIHKHWKAIWGAITTITGAVSGYIKTHFKAIVGAITLLFPPLGLAIAIFTRVKDHWGTISKVIGNIVKTLVKDWKEGWHQITDAVKVAWDLVKPIFDMIGKGLGWVGNLLGLGGKGSKSGSGGLLGTVGGWILGRATGGPVNAGQPYMVGERGPELIIPQQRGYVVPNDITSAAMSVNNTNAFGQETIVVPGNGNGDVNMYIYPQSEFDVVGAVNRALDQRDRKARSNMERRHA